MSVFSVPYFLRSAARQPQNEIFILCIFFSWPPTKGRFAGGADSACIIVYQFPDGFSRKYPKLCREGSGFVVIMVKMHNAKLVQISNYAEISVEAGKSLTKT